MLAPDPITALPPVCQSQPNYCLPAREEAPARLESFALFLKDVEKWWSVLGTDLAIRNPQLSQDKLTFAVRRTADRLLFLRLCEDRGIEPRRQLHHLLSGPNTYARLCEVYRLAERSFHSSLFHFTRSTHRSDPPDEWTLSLRVDDRTLKQIIRRLYSPQGSGAVSSLGADLLGRVYERSLGKEIRLAKDGRVVVEDAPQSKKAGGAYYTPRFIVDYIADRTVGKILEGKTPFEVAARTPAGRPAAGRRPLSVLDPACGSGAFLLGAYRYLLEWHRGWYTKNEPTSHTDRVYRNCEHEWKLTTAERVRILQDHIYGVDVDAPAVEMTRLSLLLEAFEAHTPASPRPPALPDLTTNIKCGDSLVGTDFYEDTRRQSHDLLPSPRSGGEGPGVRGCRKGSKSGSRAGADPRRINAFDWAAEFPAVLEGGGFDAVIGNPPYLNARLVTQTLGDEVKSYFRRTYRTAQGGYDLYVLFAERSYQLLRDRGMWGMIIPNKIATLDYALECRKLLLHHTTLVEITDVSRMKAFSDASVYPYIVIWRKTTPRSDHRIQVKQALATHDLHSDAASRRVTQSSLTAETGLTVHGRLHVEDRVPTQPLGDRARLHSGTTGFSAQKIAKCLIENATPNGAEQALPSPRSRGKGPGVGGLQKSPEYFEFIVSGNIDRYAIAPGDVRFMNRIFTRPVLPTSENQLTANKRTLYAGEKIVIAGLTRRLEAAYDPGGLALGVQVYAAADMADDPRYLLALVNSKLLSYLFRIRFQAKHLAGGFLAINKGQLAQLPIRKLDLANPREQEQHRDLVRLVDHVHSLRDKLLQASRAGEQTALERQVTTTDRQIDDLVYQLYALTDREICLVEDAIGK